MTADHHVAFMRTTIQFLSASLLVVPAVVNPNTFGYRWNEQLTRKNGSLVTLPEYYRLDSDGKKPQWSVVSPKDVPPELGLTQYRFETPKEEPQEPRTTPDDAASCWKKPGPAAGPFQARLGDGSPAQRQPLTCNPQPPPSGNLRASPTTAGGQT